MHKYLVNKKYTCKQYSCVDGDGTYMATHNQYPLKKHLKLLCFLVIVYFLLSSFWLLLHEQNPAQQYYLTAIDDTIFLTSNPNDPTLLYPNQYYAIWIGSTLYIGIHSQTTLARHPVIDSSSGLIQDFDQFPNGTYRVLIVWPTGQATYTISKADEYTFTDDTFQLGEVLGVKVFLISPVYAFGLARIFYMFGIIAIAFWPRTPSHDKPEVLVSPVADLPEWETHKEVSVRYNRYLQFLRPFLLDFPLILYGVGLGVGLLLTLTHPTPSPVFYECLMSGCLPYVVQIGLIYMIYLLIIVFRRRNFFTGIQNLTLRDQILQWFQRAQTATVVVLGSILSISLFLFVNSIPVLSYPISLLLISLLQGQTSILLQLPGYLPFIGVSLSPLLLITIDIRLLMEYYYWRTQTKANIQKTSVKDSIQGTESLEATS